jgi:predicted dehydrogenase
MLKIGILGAGFMGTTHAAAWANTPAKIHGICSPKGADVLAQQYGGTVYESYEAMLGDVDVIDICTPTYLHYEQVMQAVAAKKHIVCEKPLARDYSEGIAIVKACKDAGLKLLVAHVVRFFPQYVMAKQTVERGEIGQVATVRLTRASFRPSTPWLNDSALSGGMMLDLMIHDFDYAHWLAGPVESVFAKNVSSKDPSTKNDYGLAIMKHKNGAISHIEGGWAYPLPMFRTSLEVGGSHGLIEHPADSTDPLKVYMAASGDSSKPDISVPGSPLAEDPYTTQMKHFYAALTDDNVEWVVRPEDGLAALQIALAAIQSAQTGQRVTLQELA